jgi:hypothetical protein
VDRDFVQFGLPSRLHNFVLMTLNDTMQASYSYSILMEHFLAIGCCTLQLRAHACVAGRARCPIARCVCCPRLVRPVCRLRGRRRQPRASSTPSRLPGQSVFLFDGTDDRIDLSDLNQLPDPLMARFTNRSSRRRSRRDDSEWNLFTGVGWTARVDIGTSKKQSARTQ